MKLIRLFLLFSIFSACKNDQKREVVMSEKEVAEHLTNASRLRVQKESKEIQEFIDKHDFKVEETGTGLRIQIYVRAKNGISPVMHDRVQMICKVFLLDGTLCYETDSTNPVEFRLGEGEHINGLEEGLMKMTPGERARLIIPNHLAYGLSGDGNKIPPAAALFIDVKLLKVE